MNTQQPNNVSSQAVNQNAALAAQPFDFLKQGVVNDIKTIENLVQTGVLTQAQGQNLMNYVTQKAFEQYTLSQQNAPQVQPMPPQTPATAMPEIAPEFFNRDGRLDVFYYLKSADVDFDEDEISKISALVEKIESTAIERYLREKDHEKTLNSENESAKQRLRANAQNSVSDVNKNMVFTREQIGKMSGAEFAKHERAIMDQLKKGLIR